MRKWASLAPLAMLAWHCQSMALLPASYEVDVKVRFDRGEFELSEPKQREFERLAEHLDDLKSAVVYIVAHGDSQGDDAATMDEMQNQ